MLAEEAAAIDVICALLISRLQQAIRENESRLCDTIRCIALALDGLCTYMIHFVTGCSLKRGEQLTDKVFKSRGCCTYMVQLCLDRRISLTD